MPNEDPDVVGDFIRQGMDELIDEEFNKDEKPNGKEKAEDEKESELSDEEVREDDEEESEDKDEDEEETDEDDEKEESKDEEDADKDKGKSRIRSEISLAREKFKDVFKEFPGVEKNYFAGLEYSKIFESPKEAQEVANTKEYIDAVITKTLTGDPQPLLESLFEASGDNKEGFIRFAMSFLPTIHEAAPQLAQKIMEQPIINLFSQLGQEAIRRGDEDLMTAVKMIVKEIYGVEGIPKGQKVGKLIKDTSDIDREREALNQVAEEDFYQSIENVVNPILEADIESNLSDDLDMPDGVKKMLVNNALQEIYSKLKQDKNHLMIMQRIRNAARANRYNKEYKRRVAKEVINAAREILVEVTGQVEQEAFKSVKRKKNKEKSKGERNRGSNNSAIRGNADKDDFDPKDIDFKKTSLRTALDFDKDKIVFKPKNK